MNKNINQTEEKPQMEISKRLIASVDSRGDLEEHGCDSEDFIEVSVWSLKKTLEEAYQLGKAKR